MIGPILRQKRETEGLSVEQIAERLCITPSYLRAIEADDVESLPGAFFYKSFALQYAAILEIDAQSLRAEIDSACAPKDQGPVTEETAPHIELTMQVASRSSLFSRRRMGWGAAMAVLLCAAAGYSALRNQFPSAASSSSAAPSVVTQPETTTPEAPEPSAAVDSPADVVKLADLKEALNQVAVLSMAARETTWLSVTSEGKEIFQGILWPRQSKTLTGVDMAQVKVGNAGGLDISWNGKSIGPIGENGEVRVVLFSADDVRVLPPGRTL